MRRIFFPKSKKKTISFYVVLLLLLIGGVFCSFAAIEFFLTPDDRIRDLVARIMQPLIRDIVDKDNLRIAEIDLEYPGLFLPLNLPQIENLTGSGWVVDFDAPQKGVSANPHNIFHVTLRVKEGTLQNPKTVDLQAYAQLLTRAFQKIQLIPQSLDVEFGKFISLTFDKNYKLKNLANPLTPEEEKALRATREFSIDDGEAVPHLSLMQWIPPSIEQLFTRGSDENLYKNDPEKFTRTKREEPLKQLLGQIKNIPEPETEDTKAKLKKKKEEKKQKQSKTKKTQKDALANITNSYQDISNTLYIPSFNWLPVGKDVQLGKAEDFEESLKDAEALSAFKEQTTRLIQKMDQLQPRIPTRIYFDDILQMVKLLRPLIVQFNELEDRLEGLQQEDEAAEAAEAFPSPLDASQNSTAATGTDQSPLETALVAGQTSLQPAPLSPFMPNIVFPKDTWNALLKQEKMTFAPKKTTKKAK